MSAKSTQVGMLKMTSEEYFKRLQPTTASGLGSEEVLRLHAAHTASMLQVFGDLDGVRARVFHSKFRPQQELQIASEEAPVEVESPCSHEVTSDDGFPSFIRDGLDAE